MSKYYKMKTNKSVLTQLKEMLLGKRLMQVYKGNSYYATIIDIDNHNVIAKEETFGGFYIWTIPYNSKDWILCD